MGQSAKTSGSTTSASVKTSGYTTETIGFNSWPSVSARYNFKKTATAPQLQVNFSFDTSRYTLPANDAEGLQWKQNAEDDLAVYKNIYTQLNWTYVPDEEKPKERKRVVVLSASTSITPGETLPFSEQHVSSLLNFIKKIATWLQQQINTPANSKLAPKPVFTSLLFDLTGEVHPNNVFEIEVTLATTRIDPDTGTATADSLVKAIPPHLKTNLAAFAKTFENAFLTNSGQLKLATGQSQLNSNNAKQLWAMRWAIAAKSTGINYSILPDAVYAAPIPLSTKIMGGDVSVYPYQTKQGISWNGKAIPSSFKSADLDAWLGQLLLSVDELLSSNNKDARSIFTNLYNQQPASSTNPLDDIIAAKAGIINALVPLLTPVINGQTLNLGDAGRSLSELLNNQLFSFYNTTALVQYKVSVNSIGETNKFKLYGKVNLISGHNTPVDQCSASDAAIALIPDAGNEQQSYLSFGLAVKLPYQQTHLPVQATFAPTLLEYEVVEGKNITLTHILPVASPVFSADVPLVIRQYPQPLTLNSQTAEATYADETVTIPTSKLWDYTYGYIQEGTAQDLIRSQFIYNEIAEPVGNIPKGTNGLFESLAQFVSVSANLQTDLVSSLSDLNAATTIETDAYQIALQGLIAASQLVTRVKDALKTFTPEWPAVVCDPTFANALSFTVTEAPVNTTDNRLLITVSAQKTTGAQSTLPKIILKEYDATLFETTDNSTKVTNSYIYSSAGKPLMFTDGLRRTSQTSIKFSALDALQIQNARCITGVTRNTNLLPNPAGGYFATNVQFIYQALQNTATPKIIPSLSCNTDLNLADLKAGETQGSIANYLNLLFASLFDDVDTVCSIEINVGYQYKPGNSEFMPWVTVPVVDVPAAVMGAPDTVGTFIDNLSNTINTWMATIAPKSDDQDFRIQFNVTLFDSLSNSNVPLLQLENLYINKENLT